MSTRKEQAKGSSIFYLIDEENKTITAKMRTDCLVNDVYDAMGRWSLGIASNIYKNQELQRKYFEGTAKCSPEDKFDIELGKKLARARMLKKYYKVRTNIFNQIAEEYSHYLTRIEDQLNYSWLASNDNIQTVKELSK